MRKPCLVCGRLVADGSYCARHQPATSNVPSARAWRRVRLRVLERDGWRCACGQPATEVDHIIARAAGGSDDPSNLRSLCADCHKRRHR